MSGTNDRCLIPLELHGDRIRYGFLNHSSPEGVFLGPADFMIVVDNAHAVYRFTNQYPSLGIIDAELIEMSQEVPCH